MVIKKFESFNTLENSGLHVGDKVMIRYKNSEYFGKTGTILNIMTIGATKGDCEVSIDYSNEVKDFFYTFLTKIIELIEVPTGEIIIINEEDLEELYGTGLVNYNKLMKFYFFNKFDRWQIEYFEI
jgi:hypothetical protein